MTERPILFSAPMVRAILEGRKTQTRRKMSVQPWPNATVEVGPYHLHWIDRNGGDVGLRCPYGALGDHLWVRETVAYGANYHVAYKADSVCGVWCWNGDGQPVFVPHGNILEGDGGALVGNYGLAKYGARWRPSIHMPRWASRITLRITDIRVERLQDISEDDARAEGCDPARWIDETDVGMEGYREGFARLWNKINGPGAWDVNPWVWVVSFERVKS